VEGITEKIVIVCSDK